MPTALRGHGYIARGMPGAIWIKPLTACAALKKEPGMNRRVQVLAAMLLATSCGTLRAAPLPPPNGPVPSPVLYVRFVAPPTLRVQFYPGGGQAKTFPAPVLAGLRPGYIYRVQLSGFPGQ